MKRFFLYFVALTLLPQTLSAAVLVGKTEGAMSVSPTGAATYTIPIKIQNGMSDFVPNISLTYNSQAGNGIVGMGFSISGLSAISIVPRSVYFDGHAEAIYTGEDNAFALDGQRLLLKSGNNGQTDATYRTENEQYSLISITSSSNGTPATFQVKTTDGTTYKYGSSSGRLTMSNGEAFQWVLDYAEDALGNYIHMLIPRKVFFISPPSHTVAIPTALPVWIVLSCLTTKTGRTAFPLICLVNSAI